MTNYSRLHAARAAKDAAADAMLAELDAAEVERLNLAVTGVTWVTNTPGDRAEVLRRFGDACAEFDVALSDI